jgi:hypothetical protein
MSTLRGERRRVHDAGASFGLYPKRLPGGRPRAR